MQSNQDILRTASRRWTHTVVGQQECGHSAKDHPRSEHWNVRLPSMAAAASSASAETSSALSSWLPSHFNPLLSPTISVPKLGHNLRFGPSETRACARSAQRLAHTQRNYQTWAGNCVDNTIHGSGQQIGCFRRPSTVEQI
jgi:hypothetical protein